MRCAAGASHSIKTAGLERRRINIQFALLFLLCAHPIRISALSLMSNSMTEDSMLRGVANVVQFASSWASRHDLGTKLRSLVFPSTGARQLATKLRYGMAKHSDLSSISSQFAPLDNSYVHPSRHERFKYPCRALGAE